MSLLSRVNQIMAGLKSQNELTRNRCAHDLKQFVTTELREISADISAEVMDQIIRHIFELVSSANVTEKKGGILAIVSLINVDGGNTNSISRFVNYLRNMLPSSDITVMEMVAKTVGRLSQVGGTFSSDYVRFEMKRALEWLSGDRHEGRRHAAVLVLRELALNAPTFFFQQIQSFFDHFYNAIRDPKPQIREDAVEALRAGFVIIGQREAKKNHFTQWYQQVYENAMNGIEDSAHTKERGQILTRDDKVHGSLLVLQELIRNSSSEGERLRQEMEEQYGPKSQYATTNTGNAKFSKSHYSSHQEHHQIQLSNVSPLSGGPQIQHSQSRYCKEFMELKFEEVLL